MNKSLTSVEEFHKLFEHPVLETPQIPDEKRVELRLNLILEELSELAEESGFYDKFADILLAKASKIKETTQNNYIEKKNVIGCLDAFCDLNYVLSGSILEFGMKDIFDANFDEVHRSNMSKACINEREAIETIFHYQKRGDDANFMIKDGKYLVYRKSDKKTLKSINYSAAELKL